ncbi:hypothetical protein Nepgr_032926 [Nepenthes gracilis]|uniref:DNA polymerase alpha subunit B n=1 Tax=Nepenthes gracilis TaxID=150966 RepID=A0AAD3TJK3_NEPGR|nr:hypothetical protein Nepgr_032926 [Nepenthes gracilis]
MEAQIKAEFKKSGFSIDEEEEVLNKCLTFCTNYKLTPSELVLSWEVYFLNRQLNGSTIQNAEMEGFLLHLQNEEKEAFITEELNLHVYSSRDVDMILHDEQEDIKEGILDTPTVHQDSSNSVHQANGGKFSSGITSSLLTPFGQRTNKFVVQFSINNQHIRDNAREQQDIEQSESDFISKVLPGKRCSLLVCQSKPEPGCRFMYDRIEDRCNSLENRLKKHASAFVASGLYEPVDPTIASQKSVFAVGMICCDGQGHLNEKSILLQSSVEHSGGQHVRLDLGKLTHYSIFPGQVVGIVGNNPSGHCFIASEILYPSSFSISADENFHPAKRQALEEESSMIDQLGVLEELSMIIAGGPYTTTDNLLFEPLTELLAYASRKQPQLLILSGPFVDSEHPEIKKELLTKALMRCFLQDHVEYMGSATQVLLVPSIRDANHDFVFPQSSFDINSVDLKHQITSLTNPGIFDAEEVKIGCCTVDILRQLSGEEISRHPKDGSSADRLSRLIKHILSQHSFYPLYPPAEDVPLDFSIAPETLNFSCSPQILILPSDLSPFIKVLPLEGKGEGKQPINCVCVNPGRLAKGIGGGTFVELKYHGSPDTTHGSIIRI